MPSNFIIISRVRAILYTSYVQGPPQLAIAMSATCTRCNASSEVQSVENVNCILCIYKLHSYNYI